MNAFQTNAGDPLVSGYTQYMIDITGLLNSNVGNTLTLRFAQVDNVLPFQLGVDSVDIQVGGQAVPEPSYWITTLSALLGISCARWRSRASRS